MIAELPELECEGLNLLIRNDLPERYYPGLDTEGAQIICNYDGITTY